MWRHAVEPPARERDRSCADERSGGRRRHRKLIYDDDTADARGTKSPSARSRRDVLAPEAATASPLCPRRVSARRLRRPAVGLLDLRERAVPPSRRRRESPNSPGGPATCYSPASEECGGYARAGQSCIVKTTLSQTWSGNSILGPQCAFEMSMFMCPAVHMSTRSLLRSSSTHKPSDPPLRVELKFFTISLIT